MGAASPFSGLRFAAAGAAATTVGEDAELSAGDCASPFAAFVAARGADAGAPEDSAMFSLNHLLTNLAESFGCRSCVS